MENKGQDREGTPLESVRDNILMFADREQTERIMKKIQDQLSKAREEGRKEGGRGMLEGFLKHLKNRFETKHSVGGEVELSKELFKVYKLKTKEDERI